MDITTNQPAVAQSEKELVGQWLSNLDTALQSASRASVASLFAPDGHWRDLLAFTWSITPRQGAEDIAALMVAKQATAGAHAFAIAKDARRRAARTGPASISSRASSSSRPGSGAALAWCGCSQRILRRLSN